MSADLKIIDRIKKLLAFATTNSSEAEAAVAAAEVQRLMLRHRIAEADLSGEPAQVVRVVVQPRTQARSVVWQSFLATILGDRMHVLVLTGDGDEITATGRETDVAALCVLYAHLKRHLGQAAQIGWHNLGHVERSRLAEGGVSKIRWVNTFHGAARDAVDQRMREQLAIAADSAASESTTALTRVTALARVEQYGREAAAAIAKFNAAEGVKIKTFTRTIRSTSDGGAREAGDRAGRSVSLSPSQRALAGR